MANPDHPRDARSIELAAEVHGIPEDVWAAIATGPGIVLAAPDGGGPRGRHLRIRMGPETRSRVASPPGSRRGGWSRTSATSAAATPAR